MNREAIRSRLGDLEALPTLPSVAVKILEAVRREDVRVESLASILSMDPPLSARVLKVANSALFAPSQEVTSVVQAVRLLGLDTVRNLALGFSLIRYDRKRKGSDLDYKEFWKRSLLGALASRGVAKRLTPASMDEGFTVGLLLDIGVLALDQVMPEQYNLVLRELRACGGSLQSVEAQLLGLTHAQVGAFLASEWGLPQRICLPISTHHDPPSPDPRGSEADPPTRIVQLSSLFVDLFTSREPARFLVELDQRMGALGLVGRLDVHALATEIQEEADTLFPIFECDADGERSYVDILEDARNELMRLSLEYERRLLEQVRINESLRTLAMKDGLTNLLNYRAFRETLDVEVHRSARYGTPLSLILGDVDHFKAVNDGYGHPGGDAVLRSMAQALRGELRDSDAVARYGGEEFAVILPETSLENAGVVAERLRRSIEGLIIPHEGREIRVTMSFGVSALHSADPQAPVHLIDGADRALYQAKDAGRNRVVLWTARGP
jgi:diguanylate cyclase (GGDEF)-like protein